MTGRPRVLLVGHDASRTGAPVVALTFLRWLVRTDLADASVLLLRGGPLATEIAGLAPTRMAPSRWPERLDQAASGLESLGRSGLRARRGADRLRVGPATRPHPDIVIANTIAAWPAAVALAGSARLVCWVHELDHVADQLLGGRDRSALLDRTDRLVAASSRVHRMLVERWGVSPDRVSTVEEFVDPVPASTSGERRHPHLFGVGSAVPRKGLDAFVAVATLVASHRPDVMATWFGADPQAPLTRCAAHDLAAAGLTAQVRIDPATTDLGSRWTSASVLLHTAREDPCPLVVLEAAQQGVPTVTWDTGGAADVLSRAGCENLVAPAGDLLGLADRVHRLLDDEPSRLAAGAALRREVDRHHLTTSAAPALWAAIRGRPS